MWCVQSTWRRRKRKKQIEGVSFLLVRYGVSWRGVAWRSRLFLFCHFVVDAFELDVAVSG